MIPRHKKRDYTHRHEIEDFDRIYLYTIIVEVRVSVYAFGFVCMCERDSIKFFKYSSTRKVVGLENTQMGWFNASLADASPEA